LAAGLAPKNEAHFSGILALRVSPRLLTLGVSRVKRRAVKVLLKYFAA
jgi:hypothetical protein